MHQHGRDRTCDARVWLMDHRPPSSSKRSNLFYVLVENSCGAAARGREGRCGFLRNRTRQVVCLATVKLNTRFRDRILLHLMKAIGNYAKKSGNNKLPVEPQRGRRRGRDRDRGRGTVLEREGRQRTGGGGGLEKEARRESRGVWGYGWRGRWRGGGGRKRQM